MPFPVAHGLFGASVAAAARPTSDHQVRTLWMSALLGICPDFDYALNWLRISGGGWHHGFTHSILFGLFLGSLIAVATGWRNARSIMLFCAATISHTLLDYGLTESRGVALWWPITDRRYRLMLPNPIDYGWDNPTIGGTALSLLQIGLVELMIFGPIFLAVVWIRRSVVKMRNAARETA